MSLGFAEIVHPAIFFDERPLPVSVTCFTQPKGFLEYVANKFEWEVLNNPVFMDIGCGRFENCLGEDVVARFPETVTVVSIDKSRSFVNNIRPMRPDKRVSVFYGDIEVSDTLSCWKGTIDKVLSMNCFHKLRHQKEAFRNVFGLLKPGGEAGISFCLRSGYAGWHSLLAFHKWKPHCKFQVMDTTIRETQPTLSTEKYYAEMVLPLGFEIVHIWREDVEYVFPTERQWKDKVLRQALQTFDIPDERLAEFKTDLYRTFELVNARKNGLPCERTSYMMVLLRKPM